MPSLRSEVSFRLLATVALCVGTYIHVQLRSELRQNNKDKNDDKEDKRKKRPSRAKVTRPNNQKMVVDDLVCPITLELPIDPVTAEDGRVYEKAALEKHFAVKKQTTIKSPITNEPMGQRLLKAPQHRNIIESLITTGALTGELADQWTSLTTLQKSMDRLLKKATHDLKAMEQVALNYFKGDQGFPEDDPNAYMWFQKCHQKGSVLGTAHLGYMLACGVGVQRNKREGIVYLGIAAGRGSDMAAYRLGMAFADGKYGLPVNDSEAMMWLKLSLSGKCSCRTMNVKSTKKAQQKLEEVVNRSSSSNALDLSTSSS